MLSVFITAETPSNSRNKAEKLPLLKLVLKPSLVYFLYIMC